MTTIIASTSRWTKPLAVVLAGFILALLSCSAAHAELTLKPGSFKVTTSSEQAGAHADITASYAFESDAEHLGNQKDVIVDLPVGFAGYTPSVATCPLATFRQQRGRDCPVNSQIGVEKIVLKYFTAFPLYVTAPIYNLAPTAGEVAKFGFVAVLFGVQVVVTVRPGDYGLRATVQNTTGLTEIESSSTTLWGVPAASSHDLERGAECSEVSEAPEPCVDEQPVPAGNAPAPFLSNPTECAPAAGTATLRVDSWQTPEKWLEATTSVGPFSGCEHLGFDPTLVVQPTVTEADSPTGLTVDLKVPQPLSAESFSTADLRKAVVTLPAGMVLSPSAADGLRGCQETGPQGINRTGPESEESNIYGHESAAPGKCPPESELGTVLITTPALATQLTGHVYLAQPTCGGSGQPACTQTDAGNGDLYSIYLEAEGPGVIVKLEGKVSVDPVTGRVTTTFDENPQLPFSDLRINFFGGPRAPLANPRSCGEARTEAFFTPYNSETLAEPFSTYTVTGCEGPRFDPAFLAGTDSNQAGGYSPLNITFSREDADQALGGIALQMPPGLLGTLTGIPLCGEPQAANGSCSAASLIGETTVAAGPGPDPLYVTGGRVYLTGPYGGAPFGLSVVVPAVTGPFNLGIVVVRAAIHVDPHTAALNVITEPLPTILDGIPIQVKTVNVRIDRPQFTFNPTDCEPLSIGGTLSSSEGASATVASRFQAANCASLAFKPGFTASSSGKTSRADGASLAVKLTYPKAAQGTQANIKSVKVELPRQLPSRLTTLQKACPDTTFDANPAACPAASKVGEATAVTPILPVALTGPAYFVSHGGAKFPELVVVLSGYGVTVDLDGETFISKTGITSSTFRSVPDVPVSTFELKLPEGPYSALTANANLCKSKLSMPTEFVAQNGLEIHQSTKIAVTGCRQAKQVTHKRKGRGGKSKGKGGKSKGAR